VDKHRAIPRLETVEQAGGYGTGAAIEFGVGARGHALTVFNELDELD
jgi:hypothetical protein